MHLVMQCLTLIPALFCFDGQKSGLQRSKIPDLLFGDLLGPAVILCTRAERFVQSCSIRAI